MQDVFAACTPSLEGRQTRWSYACAQSMRGRQSLHVPSSAQHWGSLGIGSSFIHIGKGQCAEHLNTCAAPRGMEALPGDAMCHAYCISSLLRSPCCDVQTQGT